MREIYTAHFQTEEQIEKSERKYAGKKVFVKKRDLKNLSSAFSLMSKKVIKTCSCWFGR